MSCGTPTLIAVALAAVIFLAPSAGRAAEQPDQYRIVCRVDQCEVTSEALAVILERHGDELGLRPIMVAGQIDPGYVSDPLAIRPGREEGVAHPSQATLFPADWLADENGMRRSGRRSGHLLIGGMNQSRTDLVVHYDRASESAEPITVQALLQILEGQTDFYVEAIHSTELDVVIGLRARLRSRPFVAAISEAIRRLERQP